MQKLKAQPHICLASVPPVVIAVGDPERAAKLSSLCGYQKELKFNREYRSFECAQTTESDPQFLVISHGVGSAGASICFEELIKAGAKVIIRAGTCGGMQTDMSRGEIVIATAAVREDGATRLMIPTEFPAVADFDLVGKIEKEVAARLSEEKEASFSYRKGIVLTSDLFYPSLKGTTWEMYSKAGVVAVEMEAAALFVIAAVRKVRAAALFVADGNVLNWDSDYDPHGDAVAKAKETMLQAVVRLASQLAEKETKWVGEQET
uniref:Nucleoside phosphorylase domain-containing protein n=1 Tax=Chromera velia CCMP2878 TaxID=1169474 RepID=A0A0G4HPL4_9ALVE|mmetsp:Transcript_1404/g.2856  ORF Transcript_1404/g.2856 Transcript_1404/m.2856 type:complete len:263 (-) Transcript_1404:511-1299(-)|eukprot:Cvel_29976.t1-p1 / transcript=Cvel_29976.t1 / gene=Cvel_29976 / organism=Chromera_velia_CCMP2878 / gene_product=Uridine phosphorylase, putative / transcript_product=Uridine phosphorylase, putative / location=Cvel_scaffold4201:5378-6822(-) / protein_length=262 / sequence_SO=supercontig / SO=protein_coding / is_pseudo=false